jgi:SAM-dependent methyltransferase
MNLSEFYAAHSAQEATDFRFVALRELLERRLRGKSAADVGCGTGALARALAARGWRMLAVEPDPALFRLAADAPAVEGLRLINAGIAELSAADLADCENVLLIDVLEHLQDDRGMLAEVHAKMAPGARLVCLVPALETLYGSRDRDVGHHRRYSRAAVRALFASVPFREVEYRYWNFLGAPVYWLYEKALRRPVPENIRQGPRSPLQSALNAALLAWFRLIENRLTPPLGLSLLVIAEK